MLPLNQDGSIDWCKFLSASGTVVMAALSINNTFNPPSLGEQTVLTYQTGCHANVCTFEMRKSISPSPKSDN